MPLLVVLRSGAWLTAARARIYPATIATAFALAMGALIVTAHGAVDGLGRPLGVDFSGIWVAGREVLAGAPARPYDHVAHAAAQGEFFGNTSTFLPWPYPPYFLAVAAALALLPYRTAVFLWQGGTLALYLRAVSLAAPGAARFRRDLLLAALAFPAVAFNMLHGQNGLLTAALVGAGGSLVSRRPLVAGTLLGLLAYKPQFALMAPVALLAGRHWRALGSAAATAAAATVATVWAYGADPWRAFFADLSWSRVAILERGGLESYKIESAFAAVRLLGGTLEQAYALQVVTTLAAAAVLAAIWRRPIDGRLKAAALGSASLLASPYCVDYDLTVLGPSLAALVALGAERGFAPYEKSVLAAIWVMPLLARCAALLLHLPLGLLGLVLLHATVAAKAWRDGANGCAELAGAVDRRGSTIEASGDQAGGARRTRPWASSRAPGRSSR